MTFKYGDRIKVRAFGQIQAVIVRAILDGGTMAVELEDPILEAARGHVFEVKPEEVWKGYPIGDVLVVEGEPPEGNPYRAKYSGQDVDARSTGLERLNALRAFRAGGDTTGFTFWYGPVSGGAQRIISRDEVDWTGMRS